MRFTKETRIAAAPQQVFAFYESSGAFQRLNPPWEHVEVLEGGGSIQPGERVVLKTYLGPVPVKWVAEHTEYDPPRMFADKQISGPFQSWYHRHYFLDDGAGGTLLRDEVDYEPPMGWFGRYLGRGLLQEKLNKLFDYRHRESKRIVESGDFPGGHPGMLGNGDRTP